jgi:hypothetical protein
VALCCEVVYLVRTYFTNDLNKSHGIAHISIVEMKMRLALEVGYALTEVNRTTTDDAVDFITFL